MFLAFVTTFPGAELRELRKVVPAKQRHLHDMISGRKFFTINGVRQSVSESEIADWNKDLGAWEEIGALLTT